MNGWRSGLARASRLLTLALACASTSATAQQAPALLPSAGLLADVDVLQHSYEALHPGLFRYNDAAQMRAHWLALRQSLDHDQSLADAYLAFSVFAATVRCGHTYANFFNQPKAIRAALFERDDRVPFQFRWLGSRMVVTRNLSTDATLVPGTEIVSINAVPVALLLERLMTIARADGSNDAKRRAWLEVQGDERIEAFDVFAPLFFPQIDARQTLVVRAPAGAGTRQVTVAALSAAQRRASGPVEPAADQSPWTFDLTSPGIALLRMPTWALYDSRWDWRSYLQQVFETLDRDRSRALVIDLRNNEGGQDVGDVLLAHLVDRELRLADPPRTVRYRRIPDALAPYLKTWDPSFKDWGDSAVPIDDRTYRLTRFDDDAGGDLIEPALPRFTGRVFVLIGPTNSSATFQFAQRVRQARVATLVGRTTGGNRRGINGGAFFFVQLPNSGIELDLPLIARYAGDSVPDAGIEPDVPVDTTIDDIRFGRDVEMAAVLALLREPR